LKENKKEKQKNIKVNRKKVIIAIIIVIAIIYILCAVALINKDETDTIFVEQGTIRREETVVGYIVRDEKVIKNEEYQNGIIQIAGEGEKVYKNEAVFQYYSDEAKELSNQITSFDLQIQEKLENEAITSNADIKLIETQIEEKIENLKYLNNTQEITEYNKEIKKLLEKKIVTIGETSGVSKQLKSLIKQREKINEKISNSTKYLTSPISGIVSYRVDGLEEKLSTKDFGNLDREYLENLGLKTRANNSNKWRSWKSY